MCDTPWSNARVDEKLNVQVWPKEFAGRDQFELRAGTLRIEPARLEQKVGRANRGAIIDREVHVPRHPVKLMNENVRHELAGAERARR